MADALGTIVADPLVGTVLTAIGAAVLALWLAAAWWAYGDATRRTASEPVALLVAAWIIASTPLLLPLSIGSYLFARPQQSADERRTADVLRLLSLEAAAASACRACGARVDPAWVRCPGCTAWLASRCESCERWWGLELEACPWCGAEPTSAPAGAPPVDRRGTRRAGRGTAPRLRRLHALVRVLSGGRPARAGS